MVLYTPVLEYLLPVFGGKKPMQVQTCIPKAAVEGLDVRIVSQFVRSEKSSVIRFCWNSLPYPYTFVSTMIF